MNSIIFLPYFALEAIFSFKKDTDDVILYTILNVPHNSLLKVNFSFVVRLQESFHEFYSRFIFDQYIFRPCFLKQLLHKCRLL